MPILSNPRHERFAQELAKGKSAADAYEAAGYRPNSGNASTLKADQSISKRIAEIQAESVEMAREATQKAADSLALDREWVLARLRDNAIAAAQNEDFGPSNRALELIGKEIAGMFVDRKHVDIDGELRGLSDAALVALFESATEEGIGEADGASLPN